MSSRRVGSIRGGVLEGEVDAPHHLLDCIKGLGHHAFDVSDEKAGIVGGDQLAPEGQILGEALTQRATEPEGFVGCGRVVGFDSGEFRGGLVGTQTVI